MEKYRRHMLIVAGIVGGCIIMAGAKQTGPKAEFSRTTIDLGMVVSDVEKTAKFYGEVLGFKELSGFDVAAQMATNTGLTDNRPFKVRVFVLGDEPAATRLKIMTIPGAGLKKVDNQYIGSSLGFRYLTINVADLTRTLARLKQNGVAPVKAPYQLGGNSYLVLVKDPDGNTVELIGPRL
jgi:catechol 2,3-dioxygenase-like lactoylglutathione lyase family enzyme